MCLLRFYTIYIRSRQASFSGRDAGFEQVWGVIENHLKVSQVSNIAVPVR